MSPLSVEEARRQRAYLERVGYVLRDDPTARLGWRLVWDRTAGWWLKTGRPTPGGAE